MSENAGRQAGGAARFLNALLWEFFQNLPIVAGSVAALALWRQNDWAIAIACVVGGCVTGALVIRFTESKIVQERQEPWRVTITNAVAMSILAFVLVIYLSAGWSSWRTDLPLGALAGVGVAIAQDLAAGNRVGMRHLVALGLAVPVVLIGMRMLVDALPMWASIPAITAVGTGIIGLIDYGPLANRKE